MSNVIGWTFVVIFGVGTYLGTAYSNYELGKRQGYIEGVREVLEGCGDAP